MNTVPPKIYALLADSRVPVPLRSLQCLLVVDSADLQLTSSSDYSLLC